MRHAHALSRNKTSRWPRYVTFYDVESRVSPAKSGRQYFEAFLWVACHVEYRKDTTEKRELWEHSTDSDAFWQALETRTPSRSTRYVVSHHVEPDFIPLGGLTALPAQGWLLQHAYCHLMTVILRWSKGTRRLVFINNAQLLPGTIDSWGKLLSLAKLTMPQAAAPLEDWVVYCKRDVEIMVAAWYQLREFIVQHDLGGFAVTRASLAKHAFQHRFLHHRVWIHDNEEAIQLERRSYRGGRCEALQMGRFEKGAFYLLDVNGMYAFVEIEQPLPTNLIALHNKPSLETVKRAIMQYGVIADVSIDLREPIVPVRDGFKVHYPTGHLETTLTTPELSYALARSWPVEVRKMGVYTLRYMLRDFALYFTALKEKYSIEHNMPFRQLAKDYPNLVYGKFGQKGMETKVIGACDPGILTWMKGYNHETGAYFDMLFAGGKIKRTEYTLGAWDTFVAVATHVTASARMYLWTLMKRAGLEHVYHVATDSLLVDQIGYDNLKELIQPNVPGCLKVELAGHNLSVYDRNDWKLDDEKRIKGVQKKAKWLTEDRAVNTIWPGLGGWLSGQHKGNYFVYEQTKQLKRAEFHAAMSAKEG